MFKKRGEDLRLRLGIGDAPPFDGWAKGGEGGAQRGDRERWHYASSLPLAHPSNLSPIVMFRKNVSDLYWNVGHFPTKMPLILFRWNFACGTLFPLFLDCHPPSSPDKRGWPYFLMVSTLMRIYLYQKWKIKKLKRDVSEPCRHATKFACVLCKTRDMRYLIIWSDDIGI
jgi:hypothetical protein